MNNPKQTHDYPGFVKRMLVVTYDSLLLLGVLLFTSLIWMVLFNALAPESFYAASAEDGQLATYQHSELGRLVGGVIISVNAIAMSLLYYGWFWTHGGQTLGMKVWHLYLVDYRGKFIPWPRAVQRAALSLVSVVCFGLGFLWIIISPRNRAWHDSLSKTQIVHYRPE